jgi:hypothetical protein
MVERRGKYLVGELVEGKDNQFGPIGLVGLAVLYAPEAPRFCDESFCSQL